MSEGAWFQVGDLAFGQSGCWVWGLGYWLWGLGFWFEVKGLGRSPGPASEETVMEENVKLNPDPLEPCTVYPLSN